MWQELFYVTVKKDKVPDVMKLRSCWREREREKKLKRKCIRCQIVIRVNMKNKVDFENRVIGKRMSF